MPAKATPKSSSLTLKLISPRDRSITATMMSPSVNMHGSVSVRSNAQASPALHLGPTGCRIEPSCHLHLRTLWSALAACRRAIATGARRPDHTSPLNLPPPDHLGLGRCMLACTNQSTIPSELQRRLEAFFLPCRPATCPGQGLGWQTPISQRLACRAP